MQPVSRAESRADSGHDGGAVAGLAGHGKEIARLAGKVFHQRPALVRAGKLLEKTDSIAPRNAPVDANNPRGVRGEADVDR